jgi:hypothetical protein
MTWRSTPQSGVDRMVSTGWNAGRRSSPVARQGRAPACGLEGRPAFQHHHVSDQNCVASFFLDVDHGIYRDKAGKHVVPPLSVTSLAARPWSARHFQKVCFCQVIGRAEIDPTARSSQAGTIPMLPLASTCRGALLGRQACQDALLGRRAGRTPISQCRWQRLAAKASSFSWPIPRMLGLLTMTVITVVTCWWVDAPDILSFAPFSIALVI